MAEVPPDLPSRTRWGRAVGLEAAEALGVTAVIVALIWPSLRTFGTAYIGSWDAHYAGWLSWRVGHLSAFPFVARIPDALVPAGIDLRLLDGLLPTWVGAALIRIAGTYRGYNLMLVCALAANYLAARRLARSLGAERAIAALCGLVYLASPVFAGPLQSFPSFLWAFAPPLALAMVIDAATGRSKLRPERLGALLVLAYLCSVYHLVFGGLVVLIAALCWPRSLLRTRSGLVRIGAAGAIALVLLSPFLVARFSFDRAESAAGNPQTVRLADSLSLSANVVDPFIPPPDGRVLGALPRPSFSTGPLALFQSIFVGPALLIGLVLLAWRRPRGWVVMTVTAGVLLVLSWGPARHVGSVVIGANHPWFPYRLLLELPGLGALRAPYRVGITLAMVATAAVAMGLVAMPPSRRRFGAAAVGVIVLIGWWPAPATSTSTATPALAAAFDEIARSAPADGFTAVPGRDGVGAVVVVPWGCLLNDTYPVSWQIEHLHPTMGCGDTSTSASPFYSQLDAWWTNEGLAALSCDPSHDALGRPTAFPPDLAFGPSGATALRDLGVRWVVLDTGMANFAGCPRTDAISAGLAPYRRVGADDRFTVVDLSTPA